MHMLSKNVTFTMVSYVTHKNKTMKKITSYVLILVVVAGGLYVLTNQNKEKTNAVQVGVIIPLSENVAELGENVRRGIDMAAKNIGDTHITFMYEDGGIEPKKALSAYQKLTSVNDVHIFIGPFGPDQIMSIAPILKQNEIMLGITLCDDRFQKYPQIFCTYPSIPDQTMSGVKSIMSLNIKKLGFITQSGELGDLIEKNLKENQNPGGYSLIASDRMKQGDRDFRTIITKMKAAGVDGIYTASLPDEGYIILKQLRSLGYNGPILSVFDATEEKLKELGTVAEGIYLPGHISPEFQSDFTKVYKEKYSKEPDMYAALGYSIATNLINGLQSNNMKIDGLKEKLIGTKTNTAIIDFKYKQDQTVSIPVESLIFKDGKIQEIK